MPASAIELPLFPLNVVLFPGMVLPLHIFEPRYRQMITDCLQQKKPFGIVLVRPGSVPLHEEPYPVGTLAEIRDLNRLPDGRFILMAKGIHRFRILSQHRAKPYLTGLVELYSDFPEPAQELAAYAEQARNLFSSYLQLLFETAKEYDKHVRPDLPGDPEELSHFIAYFLEIPNEQKQYFLELTSTIKRLQEVIAVLRRELPFMRQMLAHRLDDNHLRLN